MPGPFFDAVDRLLSVSSKGINMADPNLERSNGMTLEEGKGKHEKGCMQRVPP